jgi:hypothetical protein
MKTIIDELPTLFNISVAIFLAGFVIGLIVERFWEIDMFQVIIIFHISLLIATGIIGISGTSTRTGRIDGVAQLVAWTHHKIDTPEFSSDLRQESTFDLNSSIFVAILVSMGIFYIGFTFL